MTASSGPHRGPRISVCVPTYNGAAFLGETLAGIAAQTFADYEVLVVDDQSTDDTLQIAHDFAAADPRVRVIRNDERAGSSAGNANRCVAHARGEWIKFLYQDDLMAPTCLARMLDAGTRGRLVIAWHGYLFAPEVDPGVREYYETLPTLEETLPPTGATAEELSDAVLQHWLTNFIGPTSSSFIHRECFAEHGPFSPDIRSFPDLEYWIRVGNREGLAIVPERLITFRVHEASISGALRANAGRQFQRALDPLRLMVRLVYAPGFETIRARWRRNGAPVNLDEVLRVEARDARWEAIDARFRGRDPEPLRHWDAFCAAHPELRDVLREVDATAPLLAKLRQFVKARL